MRASKNQWAISPETIMSHHFRLAKGVPHVVDSTPPYSMYNSPISVHYVPKRSSSADPFRRKTLSKSQRELNDFVNGNGGPHGLKLPLPIRSSLTSLVKPKLLENRNYQPPRRRPPQKPQDNQMAEDVKNKERFLRINNFKDAVLSELIENEQYSDQMIIKCIKRHMENLAGIVPWDDLEEASDDLIKRIGISTVVKNGKHSKSRYKEKRSQKPFKIERIGSPHSLESLSSPSSSSAKTSSSSSSTCPESDSIGSS